MCVRLLAPRVTSCTSLKASSWQSYLQNFEESFASLTLWRHVRQACYAFVNIFCTVAIVVLLTVSDRHCELCIMGYVCVCCRLRTCVLWTTSLCLVVFIMYLCSCVSVVSCIMLVTNVVDLWDTLKRLKVNWQKSTNNCCSFSLWRYFSNLHVATWLARIVPIFI